MSSESSVFTKFQRMRWVMLRALVPVLCCCIAAPTMPSGSIFLFPCLLQCSTRCKLQCQLCKEAKQTQAHCQRQLSAACACPQLEQRFAAAAGRMLAPVAHLLLTAPAAQSATAHSMAAVAAAHSACGALNMAADAAAHRIAGRPRLFDGGCRCSLGRRSHLLQPAQRAHQRAT